MSTNLLMQVHSPTARARREQIVAAATTVIAQQGYRAATFATIAAHAGIKSTRTISYHFANRDELIDAVTTSIFETIHQFMSVPPENKPTDQLAAHIRATVALNDAHREPMSALMSIFLEHHPAAGDEPETYGSEQETAVMSPIEAILAAGQDDGSFTSFDTQIMAATIQRSLDGIAFLLRTHPELDLEHYADELVATFDRATRS